MSICVEEEKMRFEDKVNKAVSQGDSELLFQLADILVGEDDMEEAYRLKRMGLAVVCEKIKDARSKE